MRVIELILHSNNCLCEFSCHYPCSRFPGKAWLPWKTYLQNDRIMCRVRQLKSADSVTQWFCLLHLYCTADDILHLLLLVCCISIFWFMGYVRMWNNYWMNRNRKFHLLDPTYIISIIIIVLFWGTATFAEHLIVLLFLLLLLLTHVHEWMYIFVRIVRYCSTDI